VKRPMSSSMAVRFALWAVIFVTAAAAVLRGEDWPEIRGKGRLGVWNETGILDKFPEGGLKVLWRTPIRAGYSGPAVADGRVFVLDYIETQRPRGTERAVALDQKTGKILWTREWQADYRGISWPVGPRATPTVDGDRVYVAGADGKKQSENAVWAYRAPYDEATGLAGHYAFYKSRVDRIEVV